MKNNVFRKYISLVLAFVMVLTLSSVTFATYTDGPSNTHYDRDAAADYVVILESVKKLEELFIAPTARQILHETAQRAFARCECA